MTGVYSQCRTVKIILCIDGRECFGPKSRLMSRGGGGLDHYYQLTTMSTKRSGPRTQGLV